MERISKWEKIIKPILEKYPAARSDDRILYYWILKEQGYDTAVPLSRFLLGEGYPSYESATRIRRKLQKMHPELLPEKPTRILREQAMEDYREYARAT